MEHSLSYIVGSEGGTYLDTCRSIHKMSISDASELLPPMLNSSPVHFTVTILDAPTSAKKSSLPAGVC
jgi:hypothetical protein